MALLTRLTELIGNSEEGVASMRYVTLPPPEPRGPNGADGDAAAAAAPPPVAPVDPFKQSAMSGSVLPARLKGAERVAALKLVDRVLGMLLATFDKCVVSCVLDCCRSHGIGATTAVTGVYWIRRQSTAALRSATFVPPSQGRGLSYAPSVFLVSQTAC
jgi:hypothetical protein